MRKMWQTMDETGRCELASALYSRVRVRDGKITGVELTPAANAHYAALAMPEYVTVARPEGFEPPTY